jgi:hypothetical protein
MISEKLKGRRDSKEENAIAVTLRQLPQKGAASEIFQFLRADTFFREYQRHQLGLSLANRVLRDRTECFRVLQLCLVIADASTMQFWVSGLRTRLGHRRLLSFFLLNTARYPTQCKWAVYWLRQRFTHELIQQRCIERLSALEIAITDDSADGH